jgi:hypothetical protein
VAVTPCESFAATVCVPNTARGTANVFVKAPLLLVVAVVRLFASQVIVTLLFALNPVPFTEPWPPGI